MFKFRNETLKLGVRVYKFIEEDEYKIYTLVKFENETEALFMDEETLELKVITKEELENEYTLLSDYIEFRLGGFKASNFPNELTVPNVFVINSDIKAVMFYNNIPKPDYFVNMVTYRYMRKTVFDKVINYILNLNNHFSPLQSELDMIWELYFTYMSEKTFVMQVNKPDDKNVIDLDEVVNSDGKLPDSLFADAEEELDTYILSYDLYNFDDSVDINKVQMKYFFLYDVKNDKYYILLYVIDSARVSSQLIKDMNENMDVIEFMEGQT